METLQNKVIEESVQIVTQIAFIISARERLRTIPAAAVLADAVISRRSESRWLPDPALTCS
ncbi:MAG: hypothetical protein ACI9DC_004226 [Gammaproteobacteria bacterium]|jgi:hypothetical protein